MNLANEQPFSHKSNAGQLGSQWGDILPRKACLACSHTALGCAFQFPLFRHLTPGWKGVGGTRETTVLDSMEDRATHGMHPSIPRCYLVKNGVFLSFPWFLRTAVISQGHSGPWLRKTSLLLVRKEVSGSVTQTQMVGDPAEVCHSFLQLCVAVKGLSEVPV